MEPYSHTPLSLPRSIRLLVLEPAATLDAPLKCSLREEDLDTASLYHALSYVWGPPDAPTAELLQIRMPSGYGRLTLRRNCATALRHLRLAKETRTIWVDAICIDQVSIPEKNQQIPLMQKIFKSASRVIIWMDVSDIGSKQVRRIFRYFNQQRSLFTRNFIRADSDDECERSYFTTRLWERYSKLSGTLLAESLYSFVTNEYFHRVWTVQEYTMALVDTTEIHTQYGSVPFKSFLVSAQGLLSSAIAPEMIPWKVLEPLFIANSIYLESTALRSLLSNKRRGRIGNLEGSNFHRGIPLLKSSEPRDKAYSCLWAFDQDAGKYNIADFPLFKVDYSKPVDIVYTELAVAIIKLKGVLTPLYYACQRQKLFSLPSWVPDWSGSEGFRRIRTFSDFLQAGDFTAGGSVFSVGDYTFQNNKMFILGRAVTTISRCVSISGEIPQNKLGPAAWQTMYRDTSAVINLFAESADDWPTTGDKGLGHLATIFGDDDGIFWNQGKTKVEKSIADKSGIDFRVLRLQVLRDLGAAYHRSIITDETSVLNSDSFFRSVHEILKPFYQPNKIANMLKAGKSRKGHLTGMIYNLALSCEKELDFLSIIHELQWGRLAGTTIFRAADEVSGITLAAQPGDEIVVWKGMDCPMVVRKMVDDETGEEYFKMISTAYVNGMMRGEKYDEAQLVRFEVR